MTEERPSVDVGQIMAEIQERVRQKKVSGEYNEEEVQRIAQMELQVRDVLPGYKDELTHHLDILNDIWDPKEPVPLTSHRPVIGRLIVAAKTLLRKITSPYINMMLARQTQFNSHLVQLLNSFAPQMRDQLMGVAQRVQGAYDELNQRLQTAQAELLKRQRELHAKWEGVSHEVILHRGKIEGLMSGGVFQPSPQPPSAEAMARRGQLGPADYLHFEDRHRGTRDEIRERQRVYLGYFPSGPILDVGCGRGEFLELLREAGVEAVGIDTNPSMVAHCQGLGLKVSQAEVLSYLEGLPDGSLAGIFCAQVIEHLEAPALIALVRLAHAKLRPGAAFIAETPNPACLTVFSGAFYVDLSHIKPIHPEAARFLWEAAGLRDVEVRYVNPYPDAMRLQPLNPAWESKPLEKVLFEVMNDNIHRLNGLLYGAQDYAVIGRR